MRSKRLRAQYKPNLGSEVPPETPPAPRRPNSQIWIVWVLWDKLYPRSFLAATSGRQYHVWKRHAAIAGSAERIRRARLPVLPELLQRGRDRAVARRCGSDPETRSPGSVAREDRRAAHRICGAHLQRDVPPARQSSAGGRAAAPIVRRRGLCPSIQAQRQGG